MSIHPYGLISDIQGHLAQTSIGASALRNQGAPIVGITRRYMAQKVSLPKLKEALATGAQYARFLDAHTAALLKAYPTAGKSWGAARKGLNLFLRDVCYNTALADELGLPRSGAAWTKALQWLEVPLDKDVAKALGGHIKDTSRWTGIKNLTPEVSKAYQKAAMIIARKNNTARVHLDLAYWRQVAKRNGA